MKAYHKAESLYNRQNTTDAEDSLALSLYLNTLRLHPAAPGNILWDSYFKAGILYQTKGSFAEAIPFLKKALDIGGKVKVGDSLLYLPNLYLGNSYYSISLLDSAVFRYRIAEQLVVKYPQLEGRERLYNTLGAVNYEAGDYLQSSRYFEKALQVLMAKQPNNISLLVNYKNNIAASFRQLKQYDKALQMFRDLLKYDINKNELLHNIGSLYLELKQSREAILWLKRVEYDSQLKFNDLASSYLQLKLYDSARLYLHRAMLLNENNNGRKNVNHAQSLRYSGDLFLTDGKIDSALQRYQQSITQLVLDYNINDPRKSPVSFNGQYFVFELFESLLQKAKTFRQRFSISNDVADLIACNETYRSLYTLVDHVSRNYESEEARFFLQDKKHLTHNEPIDVALQLYKTTNDRKYLEQAFEFDERNKAVVLAQQVQQHQARLKLALPPDLLQRERAIKKEIQQIYLGQSESSSATLDRLRDLQIQLAQTQKLFDQVPAYRQARALNNIVGITQLQSLIPDNGAILSYHVGDTTLVTFFITKKSFDYASTHIDSVFIASIHPLFVSLQSRFENNKMVVDKSLSNIYNRLLLPFEEELANHEQLMIIPDDELVWIPFQALRNARGELLIEHHSVAFNYSCSILNELGNIAANRNPTILGMAPFTEKGPFSLPATSDEIAKLPGKKVTASAATKQYFLDSAGSYNIIHLATHAYVDDSLPDRSFVRFYDDNLYASEIVDLPLKNTQLVVLSACETGSGELIRGEGLMSLTRAFSYAGCPETIASLWKADDYSTANLASGLHRYMANGLGRAEALRMATLDYLNDDKIVVSQKSPAYWAHLRLIGTFDILKKNRSYRIILIIAIAALAVGFIIYFSRRAVST